MVKSARKTPPRPPVDPNRAAATLCKREFKFFVQEFWETTSAEILVWEPHMDVLCMEFETAVRRLFMRYRTGPKGERIPVGRQAKEYDLVINIPPGTSKTSIITIMGPVWAWINDPTLRIITGSYAARLSVSISVKSRNILRHPKFRLFFPEIIVKDDEDAKADYKNTQLGQRYSTSTEGAVTGEHGHLIIIDDPINPKGAKSAAEIEKANEWLDGTLSTRKIDKAVTLTILIMQRLASNDPTGHLLKKAGKEIRHVCLPAEISRLVKPRILRQIYQDGLLSPLRMPPKVLAAMKIDLGSYGYAAQMAQSPIPLGGGIWKKWFIEVPDEHMPPAKMMTQYGTDWDLAYTKQDKNSASAYVTAGRIEEKIYIDDLGWDWLEFPELIKWMKAKPRPHYIEAKASGKSAKQSLNKARVTAIEVDIAGGGDKEARARMATPVAEAGRVYIRKSLVDRLYNDTKQGILLFPKAEHTDLADCLAASLQRLGGGNQITVANEGEDLLPEELDDFPDDDDY